MGPNLYHNQSSNVWKTWALMAVFLSLVIAIGWFISYYYQSPGILYVAVIFASVMNIVAYWRSDKIVLRLHKAKPATREEYFDLWNATENLSIAAGLPMPKLYVIDDPAPNAFATGRNKEHGVVAVTTGLLQILDKSELEGVVAHELAHIGNRDILLQTIVVVLVGFVAILSDFFIRTQIFGGRGRNGGKGGGALVLVGIAFAILAPLSATLIQLAISRKREFLADATAALLTRYPEGLASALRKISGSPTVMRTAHDATAHMFIANPFGPKKRSGMHKLFMTHPPVEQRIAALTAQRS
jgi:heat shock protein HtpX